MMDPNFSIDIQLKQYLNSMSKVMTSSISLIKLVTIVEISIYNTFESSKEHA